MIEDQRIPYHGKQGTCPSFPTQSCSLETNFCLEVMGGLPPEFWIRCCLLIEPLWCFLWIVFCSRQDVSSLISHVSPPHTLLNIVEWLFSELNGVSSSTSKNTIKPPFPAPSALDGISWFRWSLRTEDQAALLPPLPPPPSLSACPLTGRSDILVLVQVCLKWSLRVEDQKIVFILFGW